MKFLCYGLACLAIAGAAQPIAAQAYPDKPIRLVVPFPPGGGTDALARQVASKISSDKGWTFVIENRPGAGGNLGVDLVAKAAPDGYTLVIGQTSNLAINPTLYSKLPYDPERDLTPVGLVADAPLVLVVSSKSPFKTLADVVTAAKTKPGVITFASSGNGTVAHLAAEQFQKAAGIRLSHIPYKGAAQGSTDLIGGQIDMYISSVPTLIGHVRGGAMRALAVTSAKRTEDLPEVPTFAESGFKEFDAVTWFGFLGPKGMPADVVKTLNAAMVAALQSPDTHKLFQAQGAAVRSSTPQDFATLIHNDRIRWGRIVKDLVQAGLAAPGSIAFASGGTGTILHMQGELLQQESGAKFLHVPYKGDTPAVQDTLGGQAQFMFAPAAAALPHVRAGTLRALAVTSAQRLAALPDVPTMTETGFNDFVVEQWQAVFAPAHTPNDIIDLLNRQIGQALRHPSVVELAQKLGVTLVGGSPGKLDQLRRADYQKWGKLIREAGIKA